jgi:hypothetical protein
MRIPWQSYGAIQGCDWYPINEESRDDPMEYGPATRREFLFRVGAVAATATFGGLVNLGVGALLEQRTPGRLAPTARDRQR